MFDRIQNKWKEEREKEQLTPMNEAFYGAMRDFLKARTVRTKEEINPLIKKILEERLYRLKYVINDLLKLRTSKIIQIVMSKQVLDVNLAREEQNFYERIKQVYDVYRKDVFSPKDVAYTDLSLPSVSSEDTDSDDEIDFVAVRFIQSTKEKIKGLDGKTYGPFELEDVCLLPKENAKGLVIKNIAENIELKE